MHTHTHTHTHIHTYYMNSDKAYREKLDGNNTRMLQGKMNKSWKPNPTKQQLYGQLLLL